MLDQKVGLWTIHMALFDIFEKSHLARCALFLPCHAAGQTKVEHFQMAALPSPRRAAVRAVAMRKLAHELDDVADLALPLGRTKKISSAWASGSFSIR